MVVALGCIEVTEVYDTHTFGGVDQEGVNHISVTDDRAINSKKENICWLSYSRIERIRKDFPSLFSFAAFYDKEDFYDQTRRGLSDGGMNAWEAS